MFELPKSAVRSFFHFIVFFARPYFLLIILQLVLSFISNYVWFTLLVNILTDVITILSQTTIQISSIYQLLNKYIMYWITGCVAYIASTYVQAYLYPAMEHDARGACYNLLQKVPLEYTLKYTDGYLESCITAACDSLTSSLQNIFEDVLPQVFISILIIYEVFTHSIKLGVYTVLANLGLIFIYIWWNYKYAVPSSKHYSKLSSTRANTVVDSFRNRWLNYIYGLNNLFLNRVLDISTKERHASYMSKIINLLGAGIVREIVYILFNGFYFMFAIMILFKQKIITGSAAIDLFNINRNLIITQWIINNVLGDVVEQYGEGSLGTDLFKKWYIHIDEINEQNLNGKKIIEGINKIEMRDVSLKYNGVVILNNVSFIINSGDIIMFSGPSGCGKTTLMNIISGIITDYEGEVLINDVNIREYAPRSLLNNISYIMQGTNILAGTIEYNVKLNDENIQTKNIEQLATTFNLKDIYRDTGVAGNALSGGERQRVCVIRGLVRCTPGKLIISDELTSNLDYNNAILVLRHIIDIARENNSILILIEHLPFASELVSRMFSFQLDNNSNIYVLKTDNLK